MKWICPKECEEEFYKDVAVHLTATCYSTVSGRVDIDADGEEKDDEPDYDNEDFDGDDYDSVTYQDHEDNGEVRCGGCDTEAINVEGMNDEEIVEAKAQWAADNL